MKLWSWDIIIAGTTAFFLVLFFHSTNYFVNHHLIPVSFAVIASLGTVRAYCAYKAERISKGVMYLVFLLFIAAIVLVSGWTAWIIGY